MLSGVANRDLGVPVREPCLALADRVVQAPAVGYALQLVLSCVLEGDA